MRVPTFFRITDFNNLLFNILNMNILLFGVVLLLQTSFHVLVGASSIRDIPEECIVTNFEQVSTAVENCLDLVLDSIYVPAGETLNLPLRNSAKLTFRGNITFGHAIRKGFLVIINGTDVVVEGEEGSVLDGQGKLYWDGHGSTSGTAKPQFFALTLHNSIVRNLTVVNSPVHCVQFWHSTNVELYNVLIDNSAGEEPDPTNTTMGKNTDGFDVRNSTNIVIRNSVVFNQDDCVAINSGANILIDDLVCYGSYGLSISVGFSKDNFLLNTVENVTIRNSVLTLGQNAIHIKTHVDGGEGIIRNVTYQNVEFVNSTRYGIKIQEDYGSSSGGLPQNNIPIKDLTFENIVGGVGPNAMPIYILCAEDGCFDWKFDNVFIYGNVENSCTNAPEGITC